MTPTRVLIAVAVCCASASSAIANSAPCDSLAAYLREFTQSHPEDAVDTGHFEFLKAAINLGYDADYLPPAMPNVVGKSVPAVDLPSPTNPAISVIGSRSFESIASALQSLKSDETASAAAWLQTNYFEDSPNTYTDIRELSPYSPYVIVSQNGGTMHCTGAAFFRLEQKRLEPISTLPPPEESGLCWTSGLTGIRINLSAYPAIWNVENTAAGINYAINLLDLTHSTPDRVTSLCMVNMAFSPSESIDYWYPSAGISDDLLSHLRSILQAALIGHSKDDPAGVLKKMEPLPTGSSPYDEFLRSADRGSHELLREIDPDGKMAEIPNAEQAYTMFDGLGETIEPIPIAVDGHRLLLIVGVPIFGWRSADDRAFAVWEWNGSSIAPVVSGYLGRHAASPTIAAH